MTIRAVAKAYLPFMLREYLRGVLRVVRDARDRASLAISAATPVGSGVYYLLVNRAFDREHHSVAAGKARFRRDLGASSRSSYRLRRNIHRMEKGLVMPERRDVFGLDYIRPTLDDFERVVASYAEGAALENEVIWAHDVLEAYFAVVDRRHPVLAACYQRFARVHEAFGRRVRTNGRLMVPFVRDLAQRPVDIDSLQALAVHRRSVRSFLDTPVPRDLVDRAIEVAAQSPSACNRQPFRFRLFDDRGMVRKVASIPAGTKTFYEGLPGVAVIVGRLRAYPLERDRHVIYIDGALAAMSFMFALETMGIASCAINWADEEPAESRMKRLLGLEADERIVMLVGYGWPDGDASVPRSAKRGLEELREYNRT